MAKFVPTAGDVNYLCAVLPSASRYTFEKSSETEVCSYPIPNVFDINPGGFSIVQKQCGNDIVRENKPASHPVGGAYLH